MSAPKYTPKGQEDQAQAQAQLNSCRLAWRTAPSFRTLRELAELWGRTEHWELAAEAWMHVVLACPSDARAMARAASALGRLERYEPSVKLWERACRLDPDNQEYQEARTQAYAKAKALRASKPTPGRMERIEPLFRRIA